MKIKKTSYIIVYDDISYTRIQGGGSIVWTRNYDARNHEISHRRPSASEDTLENVYRSIKRNEKIEKLYS